MRRLRAPRSSQDIRNDGILDIVIVKFLFIVSLCSQSRNAKVRYDKDPAAKEVPVRYSIWLLNKQEQ